MTIWPIWDRTERRAHRNARRIDRAVANIPSHSLREQADIAASLQRGVQYAMGADVEGDIAEFGTASGFTSSIIARTMSEIGLRKGQKLWLFDSFAGLPASTLPADTESPHVKSGTWGEGTCPGLSSKQLHDRITKIIPAERLYIGEGWFSDTVPQIPADVPFAMLHVDGDLYQSAMDCLTPLLERRQVSDGALIVFDDWNCNRGSNTFGERRAWADLTERFKIDAEVFGHSSWAGEAFIVHSYSA